MLAKTKENPRPGVKMPLPGTLVANAARAGVTFTMTTRSGTTFPVLQDSLQEQYKKWTVPPQNAKERAQFNALNKRSAQVGWMVTQAESDVSALGSVLAAATTVSDNCNRIARDLTDFVNHMPNDPRVRTATATALRGARKAEGNSGVATALLGGFESVVAGGPPEPLDQSFDALEASMPLEVTVTDEDVDREIKVYSKAYVNAHASGAAATSANASGPTRSVQNESPLPPGAIASGIDPMHVSPGDAVKLLPPSSPYRKAFEASDAVNNGDYGTAIRKASSLVPPNTPIGKTLKTAWAVFDTVKDVTR